jgi:hypothetical protein
MSTEIDLRDWRGGQTNAERLCAGILEISGYTDVDPQAPLGGPDDKKDILARRRGLSFVAAVFFPPTLQSFSNIQDKFVKDREGVLRHRADGFIFLVNQPLTISQRNTLLSLGGPNAVTSASRESRLGGNFGPCKFGSAIVLIPCLRLHLRTKLGPDLQSFLNGGGRRIERQRRVRLTLSTSLPNCTMAWFIYILSWMATGALHALLATRRHRNWLVGKLAGPRQSRVS